MLGFNLILILEVQLLLHSKFSTAPSSKMKTK